MKIFYTTPSSFEITDAEFSIVNRLCHTAPTDIRGKILAIKFIKDQYNLNLRQAKDIVDSVGMMPRLELKPAYVPCENNDTAAFNDTLGSILARGNKNHD